MNKTLFAFIAALLITTAPICAELESTYSTATVTTSDYETTVSHTTHSENSDYLAALSESDAKFFKAMSALYIFLGAGFMALAQGRYHATKDFSNTDIHAIGQQYDAMRDAIVGAFFSAIGIGMYVTAPKSSSDQSHSNQ